MLNRSFPVYYCKASLVDVVLPTSKIKTDELDRWYIIGYSGVDGIEFRVKKDVQEDTVYAYYPIDDEHIKIADSVEELIRKWKDGSIVL